MLALGLFLRLSLNKNISMPKFKVYTALLSQSGTDAPVPTILENTLGNIVWTYFDIGVYRGTLIGAFPINKYFGPSPSDGFDADVNRGGGGTAYFVYRIDDDTIQVNTGADDTLLISPIDIRIYNSPLLEFVESLVKSAVIVDAVNTGVDLTKSLRVTVNDESIDLGISAN